MKIAILGKNGQIGAALIQALQADYKVYSFSRNNISKSNDLDLLDDFIENLSLIQPDIIINCVAFTEVDLAEEEQDKAHKLNSYLPSILAKAANKLNSLLIHFSSDYVYPGTGETPWDEVSRTGPKSVYASTKLAGDLSIINYANRYLIFRTSWVYSKNGKNFPNTMLEIGKNKNFLKIVSDQIGSPTSANLIASTVKMFLFRHIKRNFNECDYGIYNLTSSGYVSWYKFASYIFEKSKKYDQSYKDLVLIPVTSKEYKSKAARPLNSRLDCTKISNYLDIELDSWKTCIDIFLAEISFKD